VYSEEIPITPIQKNVNETGETEGEEQNKAKKPVPGSIAFVPSVAGLMIAGEIVKDLTGKHGKM